MKSLEKVFVSIVAIALILGFSGTASATEFRKNLKETKWEDGRLRIEGQGWAGIRSGRRSRTDDYGVTATVEKEFALGHRLSAGLRAMPLFFMSESDSRGRDGNNILGAGLGFSVRYYVKEVHDGFFFESYETAIWQSDTFRGNSGRVNFLTEVGVGYEFDNDWHVALKWRHMSNAGIASRNAGVNGLGIGIGFSF